MGDKDDGMGLALNLSLGITQNNQRQPCLKKLFQSFDRNPDTISFLKGIDVNQAPTVTDCEEEGGVSSPNSTISCLSGKRSERETVGEENEAERTSCSCDSDNEEGGGGDDGDGSRKKLRLSREQSMVLEETFKEHSKLNPKQKLTLANQLNLRPRQVEVWFQNRRARTKLKQTEVDCEYLKRCCEDLTQENRRLQKEVQELRTSPNVYRNMKPPTTLTMCPSCERVAVSSSSAASSAAAAAVLTIPSGCQPVSSNGQRPIPLNPWAALPIQQRRLDAPTSRP